MYDIQELAGGISMDSVMLRVCNALMVAGGHGGMDFANIITHTHGVEGGDDIIIRNKWDTITINQSTFNRLVDSGDIEVYVRNR